MNIGRAFSFMFQDQDWIVRLLIAGALLVIPVVNIFGVFAVGGYCVLITRNVLAGYDLPLPTWDNIGDLFLIGFKAAIASLIWTVPTVILALILITAAAMSDSGGLVVLAFLLMIVLGLLLVFILPAVSGRFAETGSIESTLNIPLILGILKANPTDYLILVALSILLGAIGSAGSAIFIIGLVFTLPYASFVTAHLVGQAYYRSIGIVTAAAQLPTGPTGTSTPPLEP